MWFSSISRISSKLRAATTFHIIFRILQTIDAAVIIGLYGQDVAHAMKASKYIDGKWVFAVVTGSVALVTAIVLGTVGVIVQYRTVAFFFFWELVVTIALAVLSGIFGSMYMNEKTEMEPGIARMKQAVGFDLCGVVLWSLSTGFTAWFFFATKREEWFHRRSAGEDEKTRQRVEATRQKASANLG